MSKSQLSILTTPDSVDYELLTDKIDIRLVDIYSFSKHRLIDH